MEEPLVSIEVDLRDYHYMPLDVLRLRDSNIATIATGDEFRAAVLLWCAAWHQVPAGSLPDDERMLAKLAGFGRDIDSWNVVRNVARYGFVTCNDGRIYHPVIAEKAREAWYQKSKRHAQTAAATAARLKLNGSEQSGSGTKKDSKNNALSDKQRYRQRKSNRNVNRNMKRNVDGTSYKERRGKTLKKDSILTVTTTSESITKNPYLTTDSSNKGLTRSSVSDFDQTFWSAYPHKIGKAAARTAFARALQRSALVTIMAGLSRYRTKSDDRPWCNPATWLNQDRWLDEPAAFNGQDIPLANNRNVYLDSESAKIAIDRIFTAKERQELEQRRLEAENSKLYHGVSQALPPRPKSPS